tara:strand:- start:9793 stop:12048 length:2256 start_codon:yes stop_codon:yes gene_type:complete
MKHFFSLLLLVLLPFSKSAEYPVKCSQLDFLFATSNCCDENNEATCLQTIPHKKYRADIGSLEETLQEIGLCSTNDASCIKDLPSLAYLRDRIKNITDGGVEIAVQVANAKQGSSANLDAISNGELPSITVKSGSTLTIESGASFLVKGEIDIPQLKSGTTADTATEIGHLKLDEIHAPIDFNHHLLSEVNLADLQLNGVNVTATADELNTLGNGVVQNDIDRIVVATLGITAPNKVVTADENGTVTFKHNVEIDGDLNIPNGKLKLGGIVIDKTATQLNDAVAHFVGLTANAAEINSLDGIVATTEELNKLHLSTADKDDFNRLDITTVGLAEAGKVVTADETGKVTLLDADVTGTMDITALSINGVAVTSTAAELNVLKDVTASTEELNRLDITAPGQSEPNKVLVADSSGNLQLNGNLVLAVTENSNNTLAIKKDTLLIDDVPVTATAAELNILSGVDTSLTAAHLNDFAVYDGDWESLSVLGGVTASSDEINYLDITKLGKTEASKVVTTDAQGDIEVAGELVVTGSIDTTKLLIAGEEVLATAEQINKFSGGAIDLSNLDKLTGLTADINMLNQFADVTADATDLNRVDIATAGQSEASKVVTADANGDISFNGNVVVDGTLNIGSGQLQIDGVTVTASAADLSAVVDLSTHKDKLIELAAVTSSATDIDTAVANAALATAADFTKLSEITATSAQLNTCGGFFISQTGETPTCASLGQLIYLTKANGDTELHFCKGAGESIGPIG